MRVHLFYSCLLSGMQCQREDFCCKSFWQSDDQCARVIQPWGDCVSVWHRWAGGRSHVVFQPHSDSLLPLPLLPAAVEAAIAPAGGRWVTACTELVLSCKSIPGSPIHLEFWSDFKQNQKQSWLPAFWKRIQNTKEIKRTLFNKTEQDKTCTFSM